MRERWLGATGRRVPEIAVAGELDLPEETLVVIDIRDLDPLRRAHAAGVPVVALAESADEVRAALARPEIACVLVPPERRELVDLDLTELTYGERSG